MTWKKFLTKSVELLELIASLAPSPEERKKHALQQIEASFDSAYYSGSMSYGESQDWKNYWASRIGIKK